jgi:hypothetical protein
MSTALARFTASAARARAKVWPSTVLCADGRQRAVAKSPTRIVRQPQELGAGWVLATEATINFIPIPGGTSYVPAIGETLTLVECAPEPAEVGTKWRIMELRARSASGEASARCRRLDE